MWFIVLSLVGVVSGIMLYVYSSNYKQGKSCFDYEVIHDMSDPEWDLCPYPTLADLCFLKTPKNVTPFSLLRKVFYSAWTAFLSMIGLAFLAAIVFGTLEFAGNLLCGMYFYNFYDDSIYLGLGYYFLIYITLHLIYVYLCLRRIFRFQNLLKRYGQYNTVQKGIAAGEYMTFYNDLVCFCPDFVLFADSDGVYCISYEQIIDTVPVKCLGVGSAKEIHYTIKITATEDRNNPLTKANTVHARAGEPFVRFFDFEKAQLKQICRKFQEKLSPDSGNVPPA